MPYEIIDTETALEPDPPETAEEAYSAIVNGVLNHGAKTVTALGLKEEAMGQSGIYNAAVREAGHSTNADNRFIPNRSTTKDYCEDNFLDIGLIGKEEIVNAEHSPMEGGVAYGLSDFGRDMQPIFAYTLKQVAEAEELDDLNAVLGSTYSSGEGRSPLRRSKVMYSIDQGSITQSDIAENQNLTSNQVTQSVRRLDENDVIELNEPNNVGGTFYTLTEDPPSLDRQAPESEKLVELLEEEDHINLGRAREELSGNASSRIQSLSNKGIIEQVPNFKLTRLGQETFDVLDDVANAITDYMGSETTGLDGALEAMPSYIGETWREYQEDRRQFRQNYNKEVWNASRLNSPNVAGLSVEEAKKRVQNIVESTQGPVTVDEVAEVWERKYPEVRSRKSIGRYIRRNENISPVEKKSNRKKKWALSQ